MSDTASREHGDALLEFGGPVGNLVLLIALPLIVAYLHFGWAFNGGALLPTAEADWAGWLAALRPTWPAASFYLVWFGAQAAMQAWLPGRIVEGTELPKGGRLRYRMNGALAFAISLGAVALLHVTGVLPLTFLIDELGALITVITAFSFVFSAFMYRLGKRNDPRLSGSAVRDFFMGAGHNPRLSDTALFDFKLFCEARPGLILWVVINAAFAAKQHEIHGFVSLAMILVNVFQFLYIADYFLNEPAILTTMDIKHENFGFMLVFGDLAWVPLTYTLQAAYLVDHVHDLPLWVAALAVALHAGGLFLFRAVNLQKHRFREDPENAIVWGRPAEFIPTARGSKLLVSGFWGLSRHFNYVGDLMMAVGWSLPCLFGSLLPWFYPIYFAILLIHRERRDHHFCRAKYGADWDRYCERVRWRIVPFVY